MQPDIPNVQSARASRFPGYQAAYLFIGYLVAQAVSFFLSFLVYLLEENLRTSFSDTTLPFLIALCVCISCYFVPPLVNKRLFLQKKLKEFEPDYYVSLDNSDVKYVNAGLRSANSECNVKTR
ncbi:PREDICTED: uncharacterized protein LOC106812457 [Priapulus caudatus]|uniref:Uncharacterized protein LOC106812457 n=1 Tax=Priapulus caudatus TaxID=37621 RepID=A0ABM1EI07_PRICU|nr:PREDICTED: uncharacterized protein LOC106812457 [Priapulus caudatus]